MKSSSSQSTEYGSIETDALIRMKTLRSRKVAVAAIVSFSILVIIVIALAIELSITVDELEAASSKQCTPNLPKSRKSDSPIGSFSRFAVATDNGACSAVGRTILLAGGNAVDAAIAAEICIGIMDAHSSGLGGGLFITIYNRTTKSCITIDGRETAPAAASKNMFSNITGESPNGSTNGWRSIAVPGDLHGLYTAHKQYGKLPWNQLLKPSIDLAERHPVSLPLANAIHARRSNVFNESSLYEIFFNNETNRLYAAGEFMKRPKLRETLITLANSSDPIAEFYTGSIAEKIVKEFQEKGGLITADDLRSYTSIVSNGLAVSVPGTDWQVCSPPPPSGGAVTLAIINILSGYNFKPEDFQTEPKASQTYHRIIEAMKFVYAARSQLADPAFVPNATEIAKNITSERWAEYVRSLITEESHPTSYYGGDYEQPRDSGTSHISAVDDSGNACAITSTINL